MRIIPNCIKMSIYVFGLILLLIDGGRSFINVNRYPNFSKLVKFSALLQKNLVNNEAILENMMLQWMDTEFTERPQHFELSESIGRAYKYCKREGMEVLDEMMPYIKNYLDKSDIWDQFTDRHFIILSKIGEFIEYITTTAVKIPTEDNVPIHGTVEDAYLLLDAKRFHRLARTFQSNFERYRLLRQFLSDEDVWSDVITLAAMVLGFRLDGVELKQVEALAPIRWTGLKHPIAFDRANVTILDEMMRFDVSEEEKGSEVILETLMGVDVFIKQQFSADPLVQRRLLLVKWMHLHGVLDSQFPPISRVLAKTVS